MRTFRALVVIAVLVVAAAGRADGIGIDPNGGARPRAAALDHRCTIDPNGGGCVQ